MYQMKKLSRPAIKKIFDYNPDRGGLYWKEPGPGVSLGQEAGYIEKKTGFRRVCIEGNTYSAHRLVWLYHHRTVPDSIIDHINYNRSDNRIENLIERDLSQEEQDRERVLRGIGVRRGVIASGNIWEAYMQYHGITELLGLFDNKQDAVNCHDAEVNGLYGEHGRVLDRRNKGLGEPDPVKIFRRTLKKLLIHEHLTGKFREVSRGFDGGKVLGEIDPKTGFIYITIGCNKYLAQDLAWLYHYGYVPKSGVYHIDHNRKDNKIENLKEGRMSRAMRDKDSRVHAERGYRVFMDGESGLWEARICYHGIGVFIGRYKTKDKAIKAYNKRAVKLFGKDADRIKMYRCKKQNPRKSRVIPASDMAG